VAAAASSPPARIPRTRDVCYSTFEFGEIHRAVGEAYPHESERAIFGADEKPRLTILLSTLQSAYDRQSGGIALHSDRFDFVDPYFTNPFGTVPCR
jgi:hypothetical protein